MTARLLRAWGALWFRPASALGVKAVRVLAAGQALWILLSRPDLPSLAAWPSEVVAGVDPLMAARFGAALLPVSVEWALFGLLHVALACCLLGWRPRTSAALSASLLYHFAPFEELIIGIPLISFRGLTHPLLALAILACAEPPSREPSAENRWPLVLVQLLFSFNYLFAGLIKLHYSGWAWISGANIRAMVLMVMTWEQAPPWSEWVIASPRLCLAIAAVTLTLELLFPLVVVSRVAARAFVPLAALGHLGIIKTMNIAFLSAPFLLVYLDWDAIDSSSRTASSPGAAWTPDRPAARHATRR